jgi:hypothetical protein
LNIFSKNKEPGRLYPAGAIVMLVRVKLSPALGDRWAEELHNWGYLR